MNSILKELISTLSPHREDVFEYFEFSGKYDVSINTIDPGAVVPTHIHDVEVYNYVFQGEAEIEIDGKRTKYMQGDWINIGPNVEHSVHNAETQLCLLEFWKK